MFFFFIIKRTVYVILFYTIKRTVNVLLFYTIERTVYVFLFYAIKRTVNVCLLEKNYFQFLFSCGDTGLKETSGVSKLISNYRV